MSSFKGLWKRLVPGYFRLVKRQPSLARVHHFCIRIRNRLRYGVDNSFMFNVIEFELNSDCNRRCRYCPNVSAKRPAGYMEDHLFRKLIDELGEMNYEGRVSYHFYGEPLLDERLPDFVDYTKRVVPNARAVLFTNGDFLTLESFRNLLRRGLDSVFITQHDDALPPNLRMIQAQATPEERQRLGLRLIGEVELCNRGGLIEAMDRPAAPLPLPCTLGLSLLVVTKDGNVVRCCNDYFETEVVGNVRNRSLREVWADENVNSFREALSRGDRSTSALCRNCNFAQRPEELDRVVPVPE